MSVYSQIKNYVNQRLFSPLPNTDLQPKIDPHKNLGGYISPVQLQRIRTDVQAWREAITEAENAWYPHRVKMQRMYVDTILNGHTLACINKRKDLSLLREWSFKDDNDNENEDLKKLFNERWFSSFLEYALEARFFGYSLIALGDLVDGKFPDLTIIKRWNISPDRLNVTTFTYSISGAPFLEEPYKDFHVWVPTNTDTGAQTCGYGLLYSVALYEIYNRNLLGNNSTAAELYGMPTRVGKTMKTEEDERAAFAQALANLGADGWMLLDEGQDTVELIDSGTGAQGYKIYENLEARNEKKISKLILGHADALDSTPGKLGGGQGEESPTATALRDKQSADGAFLEDVVNTELIPRLIALGFTIDPKFKFCFSNNVEIEEKRRTEDADNKATAEIAKTMKEAGLEMDAAYFEKRTGIKATKIEPVVTEPTPPVQPAKPAFTNRIKNKLDEIYK